MEHPITKEQAAEILSVSLRTINNWMSDGTLPPAQYIGRRAYWSPLLFKKWLDSRLGSHSEDMRSLPVASVTESSPRRRGRPSRSGR
jgi:predicted DNA-binding transcriptional regulator AlpA